MALENSRIPSEDMSPLNAGAKGAKMDATHLLV